MFPVVELISEMSRTAAAHVPLALFRIYIAATHSAGGSGAGS